MREQAGPGGFTLVELLVSLVVLGLLMVGLQQGMHVGLRAWDQQSRMVGERQDLDATDRALRQLLVRIDPGNGASQPQLSGKTDEIDFQSELPSVVALPTHRADLTLEVDGAHQLVLHWKPHLHEVPIGPPPRTSDEVLLSGVAHLKIRYYKPATPDIGPAGWSDEWSGPAPPEMIKIHIDFAAGDPRHWPDIVVAPILVQAGA